MFRINANNAQVPFAPDYFAIITNFLHGRSNFHNSINTDKNKRENPYFSTFKAFLKLCSYYIPF
ncbi:hypothetical protein A2933_00435 [Candidatus Nomurabacteria bacterium RIFCSPLOWO2_01_FULL_46_18]|uniref:Uncharacterized protein n=1 Tax=Candidatus Nomurabacteria bacterium RIFCSPLOWO2_01_FULL_46_18 TaxID=1801783 RepID=A0A1F6XDT5_9BACT|nr:MAG: hypothetical protein A2933_00435 [Candidatus Nomurabacteria bacterium RIFCSPLOWO2_01_FULL_46_18]